MMKQKNNVPDQIAVGYELAIGQKISTEKLAVMQNLYGTAMREYQTKKNRLVSNRKQPSEDMPELKALSLVANAILNLDEFVTRN